MTVMRELVSVWAFDRALTILATIGPTLGLVIGLIVGWRRRLGAAAAAKGLLCGLMCTLVLVLWRVYGAITDSLGPSSVRNLLAQICLFLIVGVVFGILYIRFCDKLRLT